MAAVTICSDFGYTHVYVYMYIYVYMCVYNDSNFVLVYTGWS